MPGVTGQLSRCAPHIPVTAHPSLRGRPPSDFSQQRLTGPVSKRSVMGLQCFWLVSASSIPVLSGVVLSVASCRCKSRTRRVSAADPTDGVGHHSELPIPISQRVTASPHLSPTHRVWRTVVESHQLGGTRRTGRRGSASLGGKRCWEELRLFQISPLSLRYRPCPPGRRGPLRRVTCQAPWR